MARLAPFAPHANRHWLASESTHTQAASALERNPAGPPGPTVRQSQKAGQFFAYAKWRKIGKYPANQNGLLLKAKADRLRFVQRT
jgi:hypothetical protein